VVAFVGLGIIGLQSEADKQQQRKGVGMRDAVFQRVIERPALGGLHLVEDELT
jgi:hypothetical protein